MERQEMRAINWSDNDRRAGPFTYAFERYSERWGAVITSGRGEDDDAWRNGCYLRLHFGRHTFITALPQIIKPKREWHEITSEPLRAQIIAQGRKPGYWETWPRDYGFCFFENSLHVNYGEQTHNSSTDKSRCYFLPWREWRCIRHSLYDLDGEHFADLPEWGFRHPNGWTVRNAIEAVCPTEKFKFDDFDGERIVATCRIEEREWKAGTGWFRWRKNRIQRSLDLSFSSEVGERKGSWKGGTIGHSIQMLPAELHEAAFQRYCEQNDLVYIGKAGNGSGE